jgi:Pyruvate/2-oxoacid:ferredoxin oxidoreductase delta subunit
MEDRTYKDTPLGKAMLIAINIGEAEGEELPEGVDNPVIKLPEAEAKYVEAMHEIVEEYGKLSDNDGNGIWVGYMSPAENEDKAIGVKCSNCAFYCPSKKNCHIVKTKIHPDGYCRLAAIGEGLVNEGRE